MNNDTQYKQELVQAQAEVADIAERGAQALGGSWEDLRVELFTQEEIRESDLRVALIGEIIKARRERGISQKRLEELSGVKQPIIARMERGSAIPNLNTVLKVLAPLGKSLAVVDIK